MSKPRRAYDSPAAVKAAIKREFDYLWKKYIEAPHPPSIIYHYCREDVFPKILATRNLWASDVLQMNDKREIVYPLTDVLAPIVSEAGADGNPKYFLKAVKADEIIREVWRQFHTHIACLSADSGIPSQWAAYAKDTGFAVGLNLEALDRWCVDKGISLFAMTYERSVHAAIIRTFLEKEAQIETNRNLLTHTSARAELRSKAEVYLVSLAMALKADCWRQEQEWRILVVEADRMKSRFPLLTRPDGVHYFELPVCTPDLFTELVLGPLCSINEGEARRLLDGAGFPSVRVRRSSCGGSH